MTGDLGFLFVLLIFAGLLIAAAVEDVLHFRLSNRITLAVTFLYPAYVLTSPTPVAWGTAIVLAAVVLLVGFGLFVAGWAGGGDAKLFAAAALWAGVAHFPEYLLATTLFGAALSLAMIARRYWSRRLVLSTGGPSEPPRKFGQFEMPYGVAIAFGGLATAMLLSGV
ncbi:MAG: prepilin peptidase [Dongiaceae bacterium]